DNNTFGITINTEDAFKNESYAGGDNGSIQDLAIIYKWSERMRTLAVNDFYITNTAGDVIAGYDKELDQEIDAVTGHTLNKLILSDLEENTVIVKINAANVLDYAGNSIDGTTDDGAENDIYEFKFTHDYTPPTISSISARGNVSSTAIVQSSKYKGNDGSIEDINFEFTWSDNISSTVTNFVEASVNVNITGFNDDNNPVFTAIFTEVNMNVQPPGKIIEIVVDGTAVKDDAGNLSTDTKIFSFLYDTFHPEVTISVEGETAGEIGSNDYNHRGSEGLGDDETFTLTIEINDIMPVDFISGHISKTNFTVPDGDGVFTPQVNVNSNLYDFYGIFMTDTDDHSYKNVYYNTKSTASWTTQNNNALDQGTETANPRVASAHLVAIESQNENTYIKKIGELFNPYTMIIGATDNGDEANEGNWKWQYSADSPIIFGTGAGDAFALATPGEGDPDPWYQNWNSDEPNNSGEAGEDYGYFFTDGSRNGKWNDGGVVNSHAILEIEEDQMNKYTMTIVPSEEGVITIEVPASLGMTDAAGNLTEDDDIGHNDNPFTFTYDRTGPLASITTEINPRDTDRTPAIVLNVSDNVAIGNTDGIDNDDDSEIDEGDEDNWVYIVAIVTIDGAIAPVFISFEEDNWVNPAFTYASTALEDDFVGMPPFYPANGTDVTIHLALDASGTGFEDGTYSDLIFRFFDRAGNETDLNGLEEGIQSLIAREFVIDNSGPEILTWTVTGVTSTTEIDEDDYYNGN
ncbi:uncharacterized protein METZ01_LOCUS158889, partial [marine metagenome]